MKVLIKLGGTLLDQEKTRTRLAGEIVAASRTGAQIVVVHGGGKQMTQFLAERGVESRFVDGLRVTTPEVLDAVLKVLAGTVNQQLVAALVAAGANAVGLSGMDALLTEAEPMSAELGHVGRVARANGSLLDLLASSGYLPVVACVAGDRSGNFYNVNADQMAAACAFGFGASKLVFLTDVEGVRNSESVICPTLTFSECRRLIDQQIATGGMQAKLEAAMAALENGVDEVTIAPGARPGIVEDLFANRPLGTRLVVERVELTANG
jgi:acetylglutamate kinase